MGIVVPIGPIEDPRPFLSLLNERGNYPLVARKFASTLAASFAEDARRNGAEFVRKIHTQDEEKRRAEILGKWFRRLRGDLGFSLNRTLDELPRALRAELDGGSYTPPEKNRLWAPGGA